jgi:hypothetical protein
MKSGGLAPQNLIQPTISLEMPLPSQGHYGFPSFVKGFVQFKMQLMFFFYPQILLV